MVCGSALFLFIVLSCKLGIGWTQEVCTHGYQRQPLAAPLSSCNPTGSNVTIQCELTGPDTDFRIRWHGTSNVEDAGKILARTVIQLSEQSRFSTERTSDATRNIILSELTITNLQEGDFGYYWCSVRNTATRTNLPNPSQVIQIFDPCNGRAPQCSSSLDLWGFTAGPLGRCANIMINTTVESPECDIPPTPSSMQVLLPLPATTSTQPLQPATTVPIVSSSELQATSSAVPHIVTSTPLSSVSQTDSIVLSTSAEFSSSGSSSVMQVSSTERKEQPSSSLPLSSFVSDSAAESKSQLGDPLIWVFSGVAVVICLAAISLVLTLIVCIQCKKRHIKASSSSPAPEVSLSTIVTHTGSVEAEHVDANSIASEDMETGSANPHYYDLQPQAERSATVYQSLNPTSMDYVSMYTIMTTGTPKVMEGGEEYCIVDKSKMDPPSQYDECLNWKRTQK